MIILGIDPGTAITGYGIIEKNGHINQVVAHGVIRTPSSISMGERLVEIARDINELLDTYRPDMVGIEDIFYFKNAKTVISVSQARGVILQEVYKRNIPCKEFTPLQIKQAMTGHGRADKRQIQEVVKLWLNLNEIPKPDDAADGLAVALTLSHSV